MKTLVCLFLALLLAPLISCAKASDHEEVVPQVFEPSYLEIGSSTGSSRGKYVRGPIIPSLFTEACENDTALQTLSDKAAASDKILTKAAKDLRLFENHNESFQQEASTFLGAIKDSALLAAAKQLLAQHASSYEVQTQDLKALDTQLSQLQKTTEDLHQLLQFSVALDAMNRYKDHNLPEASTLLKAEQQLQKLNTALSNEATERQP